MVSMHVSILIEHEFEAWLGQTKDYEFDIWCFSIKHATLSNKSKDWVVWNLDNVSEWGDMSNH